MVKEGEGGIELKKNSSLQKATGQGKETEGIKYPYPAPHVLAFMEDQFGSLDQMATAPTRHAYHFALMLVFYLEMQKRKRLKEIVVMTENERKVAAMEFLEKEKIEIGGISPYQKAAMEVFSNALGARRKAKKSK